MTPEPRDTSDWTDVRGDGGVLKRVMREGNPGAGMPVDGWCAKVEYDAYIEGGWFHGKKVDTSRDRPSEDGDYMFLLGDTHSAVKEGYVIRGLNAGCETMHRGEMAEFLFTPAYAYGAAGSKSRPKVPPNATLRLEVEMRTWKPVLSDERNMLDMTWEERLEAAHAAKDSATEHFREGQPEEARERYWKAGMLMDVIGNPGTPIEMPAERIEEQNALGLACWLNEAMCYIKMAQTEESTGKNYKGQALDSKTSTTVWRKAIESCDVALKLDAGSAKAHYRRGMAFARLHEFDEAKAAYTRALLREPHNREIRAALEALKVAHAEATEADAKMYQKVLRKSRGLYSEPLAEVSLVGSGVAARALPRNPRVWLAFRCGDALLGRVEIELWADRLPRTAENFRQLCTGEAPPHSLTRRPMHYSGSPIHRVVPGMGLVGGDIIFGDGRAGASIYGHYFSDEGFVASHDAPGLLTMANAGRDTNSSQFVLTTAAAPHLDGRHVVFGRVLSGLDVVRRVEAMPTLDEKLLEAVTIDDCGELR